MTWTSSTPGWARVLATFPRTTCGRSWASGTPPVLRLRLHRHPASLRKSTSPPCHEVRPPRGWLRHREPRAVPSAGAASGLLPVLLQGDGPALPPPGRL
eukprot:2185424-Alexandrium_andersonii.AAC.1